MFFIFPTAAPQVGDYADTQIEAFGNTLAVPLNFERQPIEFAPTILQLEFAAGTLGAVSIRLFFAPAAGAAAIDQIEIFNDTLIPGAIPVGQYLNLIGGQGGCKRVWRDVLSGIPWTLRASSAGLAGISSRFRGEYIWARGVL